MGTVIANALQTRLDEVFKIGFEYANLPQVATAENAVFFMQGEASGSAVVTEQFAGPGQWNEHSVSQEIEDAEISTANLITHNVVNFKRRILIPIEDLEDDNKHGVIEEAVQQLGQRGRIARDRQSLLIYGRGFGTTTTNDGGNLYANAHNAISGDTIDTLETGALTPANLEVMVRSLTEQRAQDGELGSHQPAGLLVPPILFPDATEITASALQANTANNNLNYFSNIYPGMMVAQNPLIGAAYNTTNANANTSFYLCGFLHGIKRWVRKSLFTKFVPEDTDSQDRAQYKARFREVTAAVSWEGHVGSNGTT